MAIPTNKIVLSLNGWLIDNYLQDFAEQILPNYDYVVTSGYRSEEDQQRLRDLGYAPAADSAHLYNLARDIILVNKATGNQASDQEMKRIYNQFVEPAWIGYSYFNDPPPGRSGHIHLNIDRSFTQKTQLIALAGGALAVGLGIKKLLSHFKTKGA